MSKQKLIMYIDDDEDDRVLLADAIRQANPEVNLLLAENGLVAIESLTRMKEKEETLPGLIVLDLNMPFLDGAATFDKLKQDGALQQVPVIVFSSSEKPKDKALFNQQGIEFFSKPTDISYMSRIVNHMISVCC